MKAIEFPGVNVRIAEDQPEYETLPAFVGPVPIGTAPGGCPLCGAPETEASTPRTLYTCGASDYDQRAGTIRPGKPDVCIQPTATGATFCFELTAEEIAEIVKTGRLWHTVLTFGQALQPQRLSIIKPEFLP